MSVKNPTPKLMPAPSPLFRRIAEDILPRLNLPEMSRSLLDAFRNPDATAERVAACIEGNSYYAELLLRRVDALTQGKQEKRATPSSALVQLGMQGSRNLLIALQAVRTASGIPVVWDVKAAQPSLVVADVLKFALRTEGCLEGDDSQNSEIGFAAGLVFDMADLVAGELITDAGELRLARKYIEDIYKTGIQAGTAAALTVKHLPELALRKYAFIAALLGGIGKVFLAIADPAYLAFQIQANEAALSAAIRGFQEKDKFGLNYPQISWLGCSAFGTFAELERALLFQDTPYLLAQNFKPDLQLVQLMRLGNEMASHPDKVRPEDYAELRLTPKQLVEIAEKMSQAARLK